MMDICRNSLTHNYDIHISVDEWKDILCLSEIQNDNNMLSALEKWYLAPNYIASCKSLGKQYGLDFRFFSVQNMRLGKIAVNHIKRFRLIGENGKETYWPVAWIELAKENGAYIMQLRPELVEAIRSLNLFETDVDAVINKHLQNPDMKHETFDFSYEKHEKPTLSVRNLKDFSRSVEAAQNALRHAEWKCEFNASHETFPRRIDGFPYLETHHLIPLKYANKFNVSIDVPENIVCLCSTCHNRIHYGQNNKEMIKFLWSLRKKDLHIAGIDIDLSELLRFYLI
ncbi:MAG: HNH endonuclease [Oscillospiraceae bacterium]|jgi:5-methylcytosine-specific restriction protein A|nr:HNH endonuclease [Oscillospiraceae bacterium]